MKVVLTSWAPFIGGAEIAVERLAVGLAHNGHDVLLIVGTEGEALQRFRERGIRCEFVKQQFTDKLKWLQHRSSRKLLTTILHRERPDIIHSNDLPTHQMTSDAARRLGVPRVCHHRWIFAQSAIDWLNKFGADRHLFVSRALMKMLTDESPSLKASEREVVYDGLPIGDLPAETDRMAARNELQLPHQKVVLLFAGQLIERKGVADLLQAWHLLSRETRESAELVIVGDDLENEGQYRQRMEKLAVQLGDPVRFVGFQTKVCEWRAAADIALVPSHAEPLGNATLEAMAHARPVIGCAVGGIPEMVDHEATGLLVAPKNPESLSKAMRRLIENAHDRERFGVEARRQCERRFSLDTHVQKVVAQYEEVIAQQAVMGSV